MEEFRLYFICPHPDPNDPTRHCFFIKKTTAANYLLDPNHPAHFCLTPEERETIEQEINGFEIPQNQYGKA